MTDPAERLLRVLLSPSADTVRWMDLALCQETDPDAFFAEKGEPTLPPSASAERVPVQAQCLDYAVEHNEYVGRLGRRPVPASAGPSGASRNGRWRREDLPGLPPHPRAGASWPTSPPALTIMWLGTGEWAVLAACVTVWSVMGFALTKREVPRAGA